MKTIIGFLSGISASLWVYHLVKYMEQNNPIGVSISSLILIFLLSQVHKTIDSEQKEEIITKLITEGKEDENT